MIKTKKYVRSVKVFLKSTKRQAKKVAKSPYVKDKRVWGVAVLVVAAVVFWILPAYDAAAPGQLGYSIKRGEESLISSLAPLSSWRDQLRLDFANNRVTEAAYIANQANQGGDKDPVKTAKTINSLLDTYKATYEAQTAVLNKEIDNNTKISKKTATDAQNNAVTAYTTLESLLLQAPDASQLSVLTAINDTQLNIATLKDALGSVPLSASDFSQLAKLVSSGVISKAEVNQLAGAMSSRQVHNQVVKLIESGDVPSDLSYIFDLDLVKQIEPTKAQVFETVAQFEQLQRISAAITASRPTADQQKAVQAFLANYTAGQAVPDNDIRQYVAPIINGMLLSGQLQVNLPSLNALHMNSDDQALFVSWKGVLDPPNLSDTYQKLMTGAQSQPALHLRVLTAVQQEMIDAQKAQVAYLVMPPGWNTDQFSTLNNQMGTAIAEASYQQSNPSTAQELARLTTVQQQLQDKLNSLATTYNDNSTKLQTQINTFTGTPDQLTQLKADLASLTQNQTTTVNNLQTQLTAITDAHTKLGDSIKNLRQEQVTNLTVLELRAATNAQQLTDSAKAQLTSSLSQIDTRSQSLISSLQTKVDTITSAHDQLRGQLTAEIATIKSNYQQFKGDVQVQLDAGVATTGQLQSMLAAVQSTLATEQTKVTGLTATTTAISQLVNQVKTDSTNQVQNLQSQINVVKLDQQITNTAVGDLQNITQASQGLIAGLQSHVDALSTSQTTLREELTATLQTVQDNYTQLAAYTQAQLDAGVATSTQLQAGLQSVQTSLAQHTTQLANLGTNTATLTQLIDQVKTDASTQVGALQAQVNNLAIGQQTIRTSLNDLKDKQTADVTQLSSQLTSLVILQTEAQATVSALTQTQAQAQTSIDHLTTNFGALQTAFDASQQIQTAVQTDIANQQSEIVSLQTQTQSALDTLTQQQTQLASQLSGLAATTTTLSQAITAAQATSTTTQAQLNTLLANPPWALATAAYVTQDQLNSLSAQLNTQFSQKSAQLDQQFQAYQTQLNASVSQLNTQVQSLSTATSNTATTQTQQQTKIDNLNAQVQTLQTQVQQLISASAPHTGL